MNLYLGALGEIVATHLRVLSKSIGTRFERQDRNAAIASLERIVHTMPFGKVGKTGRINSAETKGTARRQMVVLYDGELKTDEVEGWAHAWSAWSVEIEGSAERSERSEQSVEDLPKKSEEGKKGGAP